MSLLQHENNLVGFIGSINYEGDLLLFEVLICFVAFESFFFRRVSIVFCFCLSRFSVSISFLRKSIEDRSASAAYLPPFQCFHILFLFRQFRHNFVFSSAAKLKLENKNYEQFKRCVKNHWIDFQSWSGSPEKGFLHPLPQEHVDVQSTGLAEKVLQVWAVNRGTDRVGINTKEVLIESNRYQKKYWNQKSAST